MRFVTSGIAIPPLSIRSKLYVHTPSVIGSNHPLYCTAIPIFFFSFFFVFFFPVVVVVVVVAVLAKQ